MKYLIDTNVISEIRKGKRRNFGVSSWYALVTSGDICLSVLVLGEIRKGLERLKSRDPAQARALEEWLGNVTAAFGDRALPVDAAVADEWGHLNGIGPVPVIDGLLAATAKVHDLTFVTGYAADVKGLGASVLNPFK